MSLDFLVCLVLFFRYEPRDWQERMSPKWSVLCKMGWTNLIQSVMYQWSEIYYLRRRRRLCFWFGLFVCLSVGKLANLWTDFDEIFWRVGHGSRTKWYNFGGDPDHASDPGVQSPKSGSSVLLTNCVMPCSAEVCALWAYSRYVTVFMMMSGEMLEWLSDWSKVQIVCICSCWCYCHPIVSCFIKI